jgi:heptosyltransferase III
LRKEISSILVIRFERLGDLILTMALVQNLRIAHPDARLTLLCHVIYGDFLRQQPGVDRVITIPMRAGLVSQVGGWFDALREAITASFDLVVDVSDNKRSGLLTRLTHAPLRVGFWPPARGLQRRGFLEKRTYNRFAQAIPLENEQHGHFVNRYLAPLEALGLPIAQTMPKLVSIKSPSVKSREHRAYKTSSMQSSILVPARQIVAGQRRTMRKSLNISLSAALRS